MKEFDANKEKLKGIDRQIVELFEERIKVIKKIMINDTGKFTEYMTNEKEQEVISDAISALKDKKYSVEVSDLMSKVLDISNNVSKKLTINDYDNEKVANIDNVFIDAKNIGYVKSTKKYVNKIITDYFGDDINSVYYYNTYNCVEGIYNNEIDFAILPFSHQNKSFFSEYLDLLIENPNVYVKDKFYYDEAGSRIEDFDELALDSYYGYMVVGQKDNFTENANRIDIMINAYTDDNIFEYIVKTFGEYDVKINKIESTEINEHSIEVMYYIILEGNLNETRIRNLLSKLVHDVPYLRIIGSYRV